MRVLINTLAVPSCRQGGAGFYTAMLVDGLSRTTGVDCLALASSTVGGELAELAPQANVAIAPERPIGRPRKAVNQLLATARPWALDLGFAGESPAADIVHWPIAFMNGPPPPPGARRVLSIHDIQHEFFPQFFSRSDRLLRRVRWRPSARAADHILTISEYSRRTICERFGVPPDRISVVPLAPRATLANSEAAAELPAELVEGRPWVVYPASPLPAKNHLRLIEALARHRERGGDGVRLVLIGPTMHSWAPVEAAIARCGVDDLVVRLGHVDEATLSELYRRSAGLIFPSLFEGFGMPVAEAMEAGCPVAVSNAASLPELTAGVGFSFDPEEVEQIAAALDWLAGLASGERQRQVEAGRRRAAEFTLDRMIEGTVSIYRRLA
jgi:glycosyltransferase involved in cell wall biosynthesis